MNHTRMLAPASFQATWSGTSAWPPDVSRRKARTTLLGLLAIWEERKRFRLRLAQMAETDPHLIDDIGMTPAQVEAEIAKPFWRA